MLKKVLNSIKYFVSLFIAMCFYPHFLLSLISFVNFTLLGIILEIFVYFSVYFSNFLNFEFLFNLISELNLLLQVYKFWISSLYVSLLNLIKFILNLEGMKIFFSLYLFTNLMCFCYIIWSLHRNRKKILNHLKLEYQYFVWEIKYDYKKIGWWILVKPLIYSSSCMFFCYCGCDADIPVYNEEESVIVSVRDGEDQTIIENVEKDWDPHYSFNRCLLPNGLYDENKEYKFKTEPSWSCSKTQVFVEVEVEVESSDSKNNKR